MKNDEKWITNYEAVKAHVAETGHFPDKHSPQNRGLLNWVKYQRKRMKAEGMPEGKREILEELLDIRSREHTGGRRRL